ncbi:tetratricopeptide repeat protein [Halodesulfovibrio aestuarii]|uniref:Tetratricopeptide repeat protein n=2 Tax=Halodesulfovibrio aestuarii TaxID=126333 RepID=A0A8G2C7Z6_9BACT|nr:tetratricopeptide repeat protein [Halodesulfovibrio aestuarii]SHI73324.1 Tetratricopeptide repeat-containing protein [Halodesulfovibrio aestuarii]
MTNTETTTEHDGLLQIAQLQQRAVEFAESGMMEEALEAAMVCIGLQEEVAPENMLLKAKLIQNASRILLYSGDMEQAEAIANEGIAIMQTAQGTTADDMAQAFLNLSSILYAKEDFDNAALVLMESITIWTHEKGHDCAEVADCLSNLGRLREEQGKPEEALELHQQAIEIKKQVFGDHEQTAFSIMNKGLAYMLLQQFQEAKNSLEEAIKCCERIGQDDSELAKACKQNLSICMQQL